jgi:hypothetical protein
VKVLVLSLSGKEIRPGHGRIVRLKTKAGSRKAKLRLTEAKIVE